jgi:hypothetical protein
MRAFAAAFVLLACGTHAVRVPPERITSAEVMPAGYLAMGNVVASCRRLDGFREVDGEPLASFDCDRSRLERVLAAQASAESGDVLVGTSCGRDGAVLRCSAIAARADGPPPRAGDIDPGPVPGAAAIARWDEPRPTTSFAIRVDFAPLVARFERPRRRATDVAEVAALPVSHRELGTLTTRCEADECELRELRHALRVAAGGLGASDLVGVRCFGRGDERECVASVAASEIAE